MNRARDLAVDAGLLLLLWIAYAAVRGVTSGELAAATGNARTVLEVQSWLPIPSEAAVQRAVLDRRWLLRAANTYYVAVHFPVTLAVLVWLWARRRAAYDRFRNALIGTTAVGLVLHVAYPLSPPRMMAGFVDTAAVIGPDPYALGISSGANQLAAMPSLHVGWALLVALGVIGLGRSPWRWLAAAHPLITLAVVVVTANHYWIDAAVATAIVVVAWRIESARRRRTSAPRPSGVTDPDRRTPELVAV